VYWADLAACSCPTPLAADLYCHHDRPALLQGGPTAHDDRHAHRHNQRLVWPPHVILVVRHAAWGGPGESTKPMLAHRCSARVMVVLLPSCRPSCRAAVRLRSLLPCLPPSVNKDSMLTPGGPRAAAVMTQAAAAAAPTTALCSVTWPGTTHPSAPDHKPTGIPPVAIRPDAASTPVLLLLTMLLLLPPAPLPMLLPHHGQGRAQLAPSGPSCQQVCGQPHRLLPAAQVAGPSGSNSTFFLVPPFISNTATAAACSTSPMMAAPARRTPRLLCSFHHCCCCCCCCWSHVPGQQQHHQPHRVNPLHPEMLPALLLLQVAPLVAWYFQQPAAKCCYGS